MSGLLRQRTAIVIAGICLVAGAAWAYLVWMYWSMTAMPEMAAMPDMPDMPGMRAAAAPDAAPYGPGQVLSLYGMWAVMMAAMMLPGAVPVVLVFDRLAQARRRDGRPHAGTGWFVAGYLGAWAAFSAVATLAQWMLHAAALLSAAMVMEHPLPGAAVLAAAGAYQLTPLKGRCLAHCRSPLEFLMLHWREGRRGALAMGVHHGAWCVGCCWLLMGLLFVAGVMNLAWIGILTLLVVAEKVLPRGESVSRAAGIALLGWAVWLLLG